MCGKREGSAVEIFIGLRDLSSEINRVAALLRSPSPLSLSSSSVPMPMAGLANKSPAQYPRVCRSYGTRVRRCSVVSFADPAHISVVQCLCANGGGALKYDPV